MTRRKRLTKSQLSERRATRWSTAVMLVALLGLLVAVIDPWGGLSWFALEASDDPIVGWVAAASLEIWVFGALVLWSGVVWFWASCHRDGDRHAWVWSGGGLALVAAVSLASAYLGSRNGVALYQDRILWRKALISPLQTAMDPEVQSLNVRCEMVRRPRSLRANDRIDRPQWTLVLKDGRVIHIGGVRGADIGNLPQERWLVAMRRLSRYPVQNQGVEAECARRVISRFPDADRPLVRSLLAVQP